MVPADALLVARFDAGAVIDGGWPVLGALPNWSRADWRPTVTVRYDYLLEQHVAVSYDGDVARPVGEAPLSPEIDPATLPSDDALNESYLKKLLAAALGT